ncbi:hypothetical protein D6C80_05299 [Aureobasidium pullulans]|nr:hypothetical protein D6C80_05299 [Aureobasidium pullulans]
MEPWQSWAVALIGAAAVYYYYFQHGKPAANRTRSASVSDFVAPQPKTARRRDSTKPKPKSEVTKATGVTIPQPSSVLSGEDSSSKASDVSKKRKAGKKQSATPAPSLTPAPAPAPKRQEIDDDDVAQEEDNKAWAQQLASLKKGTSLAPPARTDSRNRTVKQSSKTFSSASSNNADADDDLTPSMSSAGDVSDMLEPTASGPSVLRVTGSSKPAKANQPRQQTQAQEQETKKQRQNRKKVEDRRLQREAEEKERQTLLETQRRTAREARGEPSKNGIPVSQPPTSSAWAEEVAKRATQPPAVAVTSESAPLLDTFEQSNGASEEDQLRLAKQISQDDSGWNTVPKGKKQQKKKGPIGASEDSNISDAGSVVNAPTEKPAPLPKVTAPTAKAPAASTNGYSSLYDSGYDAGSHPDDSQWAA